MTLPQPEQVDLLLDRSAARSFYDSRYRHGYMEAWGRETTRRIADVITELEPGQAGTALDFGCGTGALTGIIRALLGGWQVYGTDLSDVAIETARERVPDCRFLSDEDPALENLRVDLLFSHHVLEHVADLERTVDRFSRLVRPAGLMLHILPCGNEDSFEHRLVTLHKDGIDQQRGGRWSFEDESHLRRLTSDQLVDVCARHGFELVGEWFANQEDGAVCWITEDGPAIVHRMTDPSRAVDEPARRELQRVRRRLMPLSLIRRPAVLARSRLERKHKRLRDWTLLTLLAIPAVIVWPVDRLIRDRAAREWATRRWSRSGSEMFLAFRRLGNPNPERVYPTSQAG